MTWGAAIPAGLNVEPLDTILTFVVPAPNGCNLKCPFCYIRQRGEEATSMGLRPRDYVQFITDVHAHSLVKAICIQGYEPLLPESFSYTKAILDAGRRLGVPTSLVTNGTYLHQYASELAALQPSRIAVSLDGSTARYHDKQRGVEGTFEKITQGLEMAINNPVLREVVAVTSVLKPNKIRYLIDMPLLLKETGIKFWIINALVKVGKNGELGGPIGDRQSMIEDLVTLKHESDKYNIDVFVDDEFGRLSDDDFKRSLMEVSDMRIKRLKNSNGVYRLLPNGQCYKGFDILKSAITPKFVWNPVMNANEFILSM